MARFREAGLYLVTSEPFSNGRTTLQIIEAALNGGVRLIQLREKDKTKRELLTLARAARELCDRFDGLLLINDHVDIAMAAEADGVHLGNDDLAPEAARAIFPEGIIGVSTHSVEEASSVDVEVASYFNIGPIFSTKTKEWSDEFLGADAIPTIAAVCPLPFTVMGGIKADNIDQVVEAGARTIALVTAVTKAPDPEAASRSLLRAVRTASTYL